MTPPMSSFHYSRVGDIGLHEVHHHWKLLVGTVSDRRDNAVGAAATSAERPEKIGILIIVDGEISTGRRDDRHLNGVVNTRITTR